MAYQSTKTYGHELGLSCAFRQWRADSHCKFVHGYAISVKLTFEALGLDDKNWVVDFGALKDVKAWLQATFDHKLLVAQDDPLKGTLLALHDVGAANVVVVEKTGCEAFAEMISIYVEGWLFSKGYAPRVWLASVEVKEHGSNSATYSYEQAYEAAVQDHIRKEQRIVDAIIHGD